MGANLSCGQAAMALLEAYGVDTVFGMPGVHTLELYKGLADTDIRHVLVRHEQGAGFMADGYARASGRPGVCLLITGPGVTNAATPLGQAYSDSVPLLVLSSVNASADLGMSRGRLHEITSQQAVTAPLTAFSTTVMRPDELPNVMAQAFGVFRNDRPRPVHIALPLDVLTAPAEFDIVAREPAPPPTPAGESISAAVSLLQDATRILIIAGGGALDCGVELDRLSERLAATVVLTGAAKGVLPDDHPRCLGSTLTTSPTQAFVAKADVVVAVGTELSDTDHYTPRLPIDGKLVRIDIDSDTLQRDYPAAVAIRGDAKAALRMLAEQIGGLGGLGGESGPNAVTVEELADVRRRFAEVPAGLERKHVLLLDALRDALPVNGIVSSDMTQIAYTGNAHFPSAQPRSWFHPNGYGTLGFGLPAGIGAKLGAPDRPVAVLVGDGGFLFTMQELATAVELGIPLAIVLWNNDGLGQIRDDMIARGMRQIGVNPRNPDYLALARAFGCHACRAESLDGFKQSVATALEADGPTVIEVRQDARFLA